MFSKEPCILNFCFGKTSLVHVSNPNKNGGLELIFYRYGQVDAVTGSEVRAATVNKTRSEHTKKKQADGAEAFSFLVDCSVAGQTPDLLASWYRLVRYGVFLEKYMGFYEKVRGAVRCGTPVAITN